MGRYKLAIRLHILILLYFIFITGLFSQNKFTGGKFCEEGASNYTGRSVFDSLGNCFFIGQQGYDWEFDTSDRRGESFYAFYGKWAYNTKTNIVTTTVYDSFPLVKVTSTSASNFSGIKTLRARDNYGKTVYQFHVYRLIYDTILVKVLSDSTSGELKLNISEIQRIYIPGIEKPINTDNLSEELVLEYIIPSDLIKILPPIIFNEPKYRYKIRETNYKWEKPTLFPHGKYWMTLCEF